MRRGLAVIGAALAATAAPAWACSPVPGYRVPTNIELIERADLVVLARIGDERVRDAGDVEGPRPEVRLNPLQVLKGRSPATLNVTGMVRDYEGRPVAPAPTALDAVHPSALWGACVRQAYPRGGLVVAMFSLRDGRYVQLGQPFARAVEDVAGPTALWVRAASLYVRLLAAHPLSARRGAFEAERRRLMRGGADDRAIAADIGRYLAASASRKVGAGSPGSS